jgi:hypothetical protein
MTGVSQGHRNFPDKKERIRRGTEDWGGLPGPQEGKSRGTVSKSQGHGSCPGPGNQEARLSMASLNNKALPGAQELPLLKRGNSGTQEATGVFQWHMSCPGPVKRGAFQGHGSFSK